MPRVPWLRGVALGVAAAIALSGVALATTASETGQVVVQQGDTLGAIASTHGLTIVQLATLNGLTNPDLIRVGQVLKLVSGDTSGRRPIRLSSSSRVIRSGRYPSATRCASPISPSSMGSRTSTSSPPVRSSHCRRTPFDRRVAMRSPAPRRRRRPSRQTRRRSPTLPRCFQARLSRLH